MNAAVVIVERRIKAHPDIVCSFFTDRDRWLSWQGVEAEIDARPGGVFRMNVRGDGWAAGRFVTVDPPHRIVFTWGWEGDGSPYHRAPAPSRSPCNPTARTAPCCDWSTPGSPYRPSTCTATAGTTTSTGSVSEPPAATPDRTTPFPDQRSVPGPRRAAADPGPAPTTPAPSVAVMLQRQTRASVQDASRGRSLDFTTR